ncbi:Glycosyltransferase involved in cell wall bisynthesis [Halogranum rubrum]|uniref:Glycosyltransferase involved in cell wall bisynthesis n=1 Tax=Halogranum rubrum TaxID=553466 RepID=A0A1I4BA17_9EURY|nr:glycosyltransferase family 4 protein [Halogranum rubrum]SFK65373.1 Glycosyltransferase involved in cell wall bisynthesis [Halogranum rubrum]
MTEESVALVHNLVAPYRTPVFDAIGEEASLDVYYCQRSSPERDWDTTYDPKNHTATFLPNIELFGALFNYTLPYHLLKKDYDTIVLNMGRDMIINNLMSLPIIFLTDANLVIWSELIDTDWSSNLSNRSKMVSKFHFDSMINIYEKTLFQVADKVVGLSELAKEYTRARGINSEKVSITPQVMPRECLGPENPKVKKLDPKPSSEKPTILFVGRFIEEKGIGTLIEAVRSFEENEVELFIAGDGPLNETLRDQAALVPQIKFVGYVRGDQKWEYYDRSDLFILPSRHEPWGLVVNEALSRNLPVVTTTAAGSKMLIPEENVVPPDDPDRLAEVIQRIINSELVTTDDNSNGDNPMDIHQMSREFIGTADEI